MTIFGPGSWWAHGCRGFWRARSRTLPRGKHVQLSEAGLNLIKKSEGFRAETYLDIAGIPTIGYGHRLTPGEKFPNGLTEAQAAAILDGDVRQACSSVGLFVKVALTQGEFDALVDFVFNLGSSRLRNSTLLVDLNAGRTDDAATQLLRWDHGDVNGKEVEVAALKARRQAEYDMWHGTAIQK